MSYQRRARLRVATDIDALDLSDLHFVFKTTQHDLQTPNTASIRVFNVADDTAQIVQKEGARVILEAGYEDTDIGVLFDGQLVQVRRGRANGTDTYLDLACADGDQAYTLAVVNSSLKAGTSAQDRLDALTKAFAAYGVQAGSLELTTPGATLPRGKVMTGMARDAMADLADQQEGRWSIQNGALTLIPDDGALSGEAVILAPDSGLIGIPEQTQDGVRVRSLINSGLHVGARVQVKAAINQAALGLAVSAVPNNAFLPSLNSDGLYRVIVMEHSGDTRGQEWYSDLTCIAIDDTVTPGLIQRGYS